MTTGIARDRYRRRDFQLVTKHADETLTIMYERNKNNPHQDDCPTRIVIRDRYGDPEAGVCLTDEDRAALREALA